MTQIELTGSVELAADIVSAYVANNAISASNIPELIRSVHDALVGLGKPAPSPEPEPRLPAVSIKKSITDDYIISLEDGKRYKSLKRHLGGLGMTPEQYRTKWGLPSTYPMVAPAYARQRSELARSMGLGRKRTEPIVVQEEAPKKRGRPVKA